MYFYMDLYILRRRKLTIFETVQNLRTTGIADPAFALAGKWKRQYYGIKRTK